MVASGKGRIEPIAWQSKFGELMVLDFQWTDSIYRQVVFDYLARSRGERLLMLLSVRFKLERRGK